MSERSTIKPFASRGDKKQIEEGLQLAPKFDDRGLITAVTTDATTGEVLMVAHMNAEALAKTIELGEAVYYSRSRQKLWHKGEESGMTQKVKEILVDCDQDTILLKVEQTGGGCCHVGYRSCFYRRLNMSDSAGPGDLELTQDEKVFDPAKVYDKPDDQNRRL